MKTIKISKILRVLTISALALIATALALPATPTYAAGVTIKPTSVTVSQTDINTSPNVTNPPNKRFSAVSITLLSGQAQVDSTYTELDSTTTVLSSIWSPVIRRGRVDWVFVSATANGKPTTSDRVTDHRFGLRDSVNDLVRASIETQFGLYYFRDTTVTVSPAGVVVSANVYVR